MPDKQVASSHAVKRFFGAFGVFRASAFRWVLRELFVWRLRLNEPVVVILTLDTMVMDNDEALKRQGCDPTYKKVKGFQPLQLIWGRQDRGRNFPAGRTAQQILERRRGEDPPNTIADPGSG